MLFCKHSSSHYRQHYKIIFYLFACSMVTGLFGRKYERTCSGKFLFLMPHLVTAFEVILFISVNYLARNFDAPLLVGSFIILLLLLTNRIFLCCHTTHLTTVAQRLSKGTINEDRKFRWQINLLVFCSVLYQLTLFISSAMVYLQTNRDQNFRSIFLNICFEDVNTYLIINILLSCNFLIFISMPVGTFILFYVAVCHDIVLHFQAYKDRMNSSTSPNYTSLIKNFNDLRNLVVDIDNQINSLAFFAIFTNVFGLYFAIAGITASHHMFATENIFLHISGICGIILTSAMCVWADRVSSIAASVATEAHSLVPDMFSILHIRYILAVNQNVHMTVCSLFTLRKSFLLASIGSMITYSILLRDFLKQ